MRSKRTQVLGRAALACAVILLAAVETPTANAQDAAPQAPAQPSPQPPASAADPGWVKFCSKNPETNQDVCVVTRELRTPTGQLVAAFSVRETGTDKLQLVTAVPTGMQLRPGLQVQVDGANVQKVSYTICFPNLCFGDTEINTEYVGALKRGNMLVISSLRQGKPVSFPISLAGFTKSYDGDAIDPRALQENTARLQEELNRKAEEARQKLIELQGQQSQ